MQNVSILLLLAVNTVVAMGTAIEVAWVAARGRSAGRVALVLGAAAVAAVPFAAAAGALLDLPVLRTLLLMWLPPVLAWAGFGLAGRLGVWATSEPDPDQAVLLGVARAWERREVGDVDGWTAELERLRSKVTPATARYLDLNIKLASEEAQRRAGVRISSRPTEEALALELHRVEGGRGRPRFAYAALTIAAGVAVAVATPLAVQGVGRGPLADACDEAGPILAAAGSATLPAVPRDPTLSHLVLVDPGVPATLVHDGGMDLDRAAESRADPTARDKLVATGFLGAYRRDWRTADGTELSAEIFAFQSPAGAFRFHREITEYACRFANLAFAGAGHAVGLQVRYSGDPPLLEQIAWVHGPYRLVVTRSFNRPPDGHVEILALARRAAEQFAAPH